MHGNLSSMAEYFYTAKNQAGETITATLVAESETAVLRVIEEKNLFPISIVDKTLGARQKAKKRRLSNRDIGVMYGQLADLIGSGVPLLKALDSLVRSTVNKRLTEMLREIRASVADGKSLTEAFRQFPDVFPPLHTAMVQAGERASFLQDVLRSLSEFIERLDELRSKVIGSLTYPIILAGVGTCVLVGALLFFVPKFEPLLANTKMLFPTMVVFAMSQALRGFWPILALGALGLVAVFLGKPFQRSRKALGRTLSHEAAGGRFCHENGRHKPVLPHSRNDARQRCSLAPGIGHQQGCNRISFDVRSDSHRCRECSGG